MNSSSFVWWLLLPVFVLLQMITQATGSNCFQGIKECTHGMPRQDSGTAMSVKDPCRLVDEYMECISTVCSSAVLSCEVQHARFQMFQRMASYGIQCDNLDRPLGLEVICSSPFSSSSSISSLSRTSLLFLSCFLSSYFMTMLSSSSYVLVK